uniref:Neur_chan_LBD domain-containing protein n=1 Tax=Haemonchus contortus TaxID=6289 RepID=A0A7I5EEP4_HAECO
MEVVDTRPDYKQHVTIDHRGLASFYSAVVTSVVCPVNVTLFPYDVQSCSVKLLSYSFHSYEIGMKTELLNSFDVSGVGNDEWEVTNVTPQSEIRFNDSELIQINEYTFRLKRNPTYYIALIIIPSFMLTFLCVAGLFSSRLIVDDLDKFCMGLTTIMSTTVMIGIVAENIPKTSVTPHLTWFVILNLVIVSVAIMLVTVFPKILQFLGWICRCRQLQKVRRCRGVFHECMNAVFLIVFESYVAKNLFDIVILGVKV